MSAGYVALRRSSPRRASSSSASCEHCVRVFDRAEDLAHHMAVEHGSRNSPIIASSDEPLLCPLTNCQKVCTSIHQFQKHMLSHARETRQRHSISAINVTSSASTDEDDGDDDEDNDEDDDGMDDDEEEDDMDSMDENAPDVSSTTVATTAAVTPTLSADVVASGSTTVSVTSAATAKSEPTLTTG